LCAFAAVHPDMVQQFRARIITPSRVLLEWKPPSRPGVAKYKVSACVNRRVFQWKNDTSKSLITINIAYIGL